VKNYCSVPRIKNISWDLLLYLRQSSSGRGRRRTSGVAQVAWVHLVEPMPTAAPPVFRLSRAICGSTSEDVLDQGILPLAKNLSCGICRQRWKWQAVRRRACRRWEF